MNDFLTVRLQIKNGKDRDSFSKTCKAFHESCSGTLVKCIDIDFDGWHISPDQHATFGPDVRSRLLRGNPTLWTSNIARIQRDGWDTTVDPKHLQRYQSPLNNRAACSIERCRECTLARTLGLANALLASQMHKVSPIYRSLTFRGSFGESSRTPNAEYGIPRHHIIDAYGLAAFAPQCFEFNMPWKLWDIAILHELSMSTLVKFKVPIGIPSDCFELGCALKQMSSIRSLTVTDIPDNPLFLEYLPFLGLGILSRGASLRELDIRITNFNRPNPYDDTWERVTEDDEAFVKPESNDWFFGWLFPQSPEDLVEEYRREYLNFRDSISREQGSPINDSCPLKLEKLRLKHVDLPLYAFEEVIDGTFLKELSLPFCDVDQGIWQKIGATNLLRIADLNYDLLSEGLISFLSAQISLESLAFARPADECTASGFVQHPGDEAPTLLLRLSKRTPMLGQGTKWGRESIYGQRLAMLRNGPYPSLEELLTSVSGPRIKELHIPADMYDVTPEIIRTIGSTLMNLEHLSWGFDYDSNVSPFHPRQI